MRKVALIFAAVVMVATSCTTTIPMSTSLSDQTLLLAQNRNIKVNAEITSSIPDGLIPYKYVYKQGKETSPGTQKYSYPISTAFSKLWDSYFQSKFNSYAKQEMNVKLHLVSFELREQSATSIGATLVTGNVKNNTEAVATIKATVTYNGETYENQVEVSSSEYNESQSYQNSAGFVWTANQKNPTQQKAELIDACLNKGVIQFENFMRGVIMANEEM